MSALKNGQTYNVNTRVRGVIGKYMYKNAVK